MKYKTILSFSIGTIGAMITRLIGNITPQFVSLLVLIGLDILTGIIVAGVFKKSASTENGGISSSKMYKGLCKKLGMVIMVAIAYQIDLLLDVNYIKSACIISLIVEELISIIENLGLMGVPLPQVIANAIDVLKKQISEKGD